MKKKVKKIINKLGMLSTFEWMRFTVVKNKNKTKNKEFTQRNPKIVLPPDFYMYETHALDYSKFYYKGEEAAKWMINYLAPYTNFEKLVVLDWGCGPGRILRHLPNLVNNSNKIYGSDYNQKYVDWCNLHIEGVNVLKNELEPPIKLNDNFFDLIYGISIFTHLSKKKHEEWMRELTRLMKKGGIIFLTIHGENFKVKLNEAETEKFDRGELVVHEYKKEGNRLYTAYQNPVYFRGLCELNNLEVLVHDKRGVANNRPQQEVWVLKKK